MADSVSPWLGPRGDSMGGIENTVFGSDTFLDNPSNKPDGIRNRWTMNEVSWRHRILQFPSTSLVWSAVEALYPREEVGWQAMMKRALSPTPRRITGGNPGAAQGQEKNYRTRDLAKADIFEYTLVRSHRTPTSQSLHSNRGSPCTQIMCTYNFISPEVEYNHVVRKTAVANCRRSIPGMG